MILRVGLKTGNLVDLDHRSVVLTSKEPLLLQALAGPTRSPTSCAAGKRAEITAKAGKVLVSVAGGALQTFAGGVRFFAAGKKNELQTLFNLQSAPTGRSAAKPLSVYRGALEVSAKGEHLRLTLVTDLESYVQGVLQSEVPAYFKLEAMKAQSVLARTYGIRPRIAHGVDGFDVCDSYLHCQAFYGVKNLANMQKQAISETAGEILTFDGKPALALFSACAGGHTENYENCFSDPITNAFPPPPISYLKGVAEGKLPAGFPSESAMRALYKESQSDTVDAWSKGHFRWQVRLKADSIEAHLHHIIDEMRKDPQFAPFIKGPPSGKLGHIERFEVTRRGVAGTAMRLEIHTSTGLWSVEKELAIRSVFENPDAKLKRLRSARIFFDQTFDGNKLLETVTISGFGSGHGVGLQQVGAQGLALLGKNYRQIIEHYYRGTQVTKVR